MTPNFAAIRRSSVALVSAMASGNPFDQWTLFCQSLREQLDATKLIAFSLRFKAKAGEWDGQRGVVRLIDFFGDVSHREPLARQVRHIEGGVNNPIIQGVRNRFLAQGKLNFIAGRDMLVDTSDWIVSDLYTQLYRPADIGCFCISALPLGRQSMSFILMARSAEQERTFKRDDLVALHLAHTACSGVAWRRYNVGRAMRYRAMEAIRATPRLEPVLNYLCTPLSEKEIAKRIGRTFDATHAIVKDIYRRLGVTTRMELVVAVLDPSRIHHEDGSIGPLAIESDMTEMPRLWDESLEAIRSLG
jgi:DNA-binding CsgD family transcriptional regulator